MKKIVVAVLIVLIAGLLLVLFTGNMVTEEDKTEAIRQAQQYVPEGEVCTTVIVDAVHIETGALYTFSNGCLAPGWESK